MQKDWRKGQDSNLHTRNPMKGLAIPGSTNYAYLSICMWPSLSSTCGLCACMIVHFGMSASRFTYFIHLVGYFKAVETNNDCSGFLWHPTGNS